MRSNLTARKGMLEAQIFELEEKIQKKKNDGVSTTTASDGDLPISYNLAMTTTGMAILPRRSEGHVLLDNDENQSGYVQLNGTALGGTLMVKQKKEWDMLRESPLVLDEILSSIGIPSSRCHSVPPSL